MANFWRFLGPVLVGGVNECTFGRALQVTVRHTLCYGTVVLSVLSVCL